MIVKQFEVAHCSVCTYVIGDQETGDTLFVRAVGRTDLPGGSSEMLEAPIRTRLFTLPDNTVVLPGHNYSPTPTSTIRQKKLSNPCVAL